MTAALHGVAVLDGGSLQGVRVETCNAKLEARRSRLRRVRLTAVVDGPLSSVRAALRDARARRDVWDCGLDDAAVAPLRVGPRRKRTTLHRRADVVRLDYGDVHVRLARLVERVDDGAGAFPRFAARNACYAIFEHGPLVADGDALRFAPRLADPDDLERRLGLVSVESSGFLVAPAGPNKVEVCYVVQERVADDAPDDDASTPRWNDEAEGRWRWLLYTRARALATLKSSCEAEAARLG